MPLQNDAARLRLRVFLASPDDVRDERLIAARVIHDLPSRWAQGMVSIDVVTYDDPGSPTPMGASETPQSSLIRYERRPARCDLTIVILWSRLGTPLPPAIARPDGTQYASGTVWELEDAREANRQVWIYRCAVVPRIELTDPEYDKKLADWNAVERFFEHFRNPDGSLHGGINTYAGPEDFERQLRGHLEMFVRRELDAHHAAVSRPPLHDTVARFQGRAVTVSEPGAVPAAAAREFVEGRGPLTWRVVATPNVIERDVHASIVAKILQESDGARVICIVGPLGTGKSCVAWKAAYEAHVRSGQPLLHILDPTDVNVWYQLPGFCKAIGTPVIIVVDDPFRTESAVVAMSWLDETLPLTIIATSRPNEMPSLSTLRVPLERVSLGDLGAREKAQLLDVLGLTRASMSPEQLARFERQKDISVLVLEAAGGDALLGVITRAVRDLRRQSEAVARAYEYVCHSYRFGVELPSTLLERLDARGEFHNVALKHEAAGYIFEGSWRSGFLRAGHPRRAEFAADAFGRSPVNVLGELIGTVDPQRWDESVWAATLVQALARSDHAAMGRDLVRASRPALTTLADTNPLISFGVWQLEVAGPHTIASHTRAQGLLGETSRWLAQNGALGSLQLAHPWLALIESYGDRSHVDAAIEYGLQWLAGHVDPPYYPSRWLELVHRRGAVDQLRRTLQLSLPWLRHRSDVGFYPALLVEIARGLGDAESRELIQATNAWLRDCDSGDYVPGDWLDMVAEAGTEADVDDAIDALAEWLLRAERTFFPHALFGLAIKRPDPSHRRTIRALSLAESWRLKHGTSSLFPKRWAELVAHAPEPYRSQAVGQLRAWLAEHPLDLRARLVFHNLADAVLAPDERTSEIEETARLLDGLPPRDYLRTWFRHMQTGGSPELIRASIDSAIKWYGRHLELFTPSETFLEAVSKHGSDTQRVEAMEVVTRAVEIRGRGGPGAIPAGWFCLIAALPAGLRGAHVGRVVESLASAGTLTTSARAAIEAVADAGSETERDYRRIAMRAFHEVKSGGLASAVAHDQAESRRRRAQLKAVVASGNQEAVQLCLEEFRNWLAVSPDEARARATFVSLVNHGTGPQIRTAIVEVGAWLAARPYPNILVRQRWLVLVENAGFPDLVGNVVRATIAWLRGNPGHGIVRRRLIELVARRGTREHVAMVRSTMEHVMSTGEAVPSTELAMLDWVRRGRRRASLYF